MDEIAESDLTWDLYGPNPIHLPPSPPPSPTFEHTPSPPSVSSSSDSFTRSMTTVRTSELETFYRKEYGKMYRKAPTPTLLPSDADEFTRVVEQHEMYNLLLEGNYRGPVRETLAPDPDRRKRALDIGSNSPWAEEMAAEFPHVKFTGVDFVPTRHPDTENRVVYEIYDFTRGLRYRDASFDLVHARNTFFSANFIREVRRVLRPGGLFLWADTQMDIYLTSRTNPSLTVPGCVKMQESCKRILAMQNINVDNLSKVPSLIRQIGGFRPDVSHVVVCIPNGDWDREDWYQQEIGLHSRQNILSYLSSVEPVLKNRLGMTEEEVTDLTREVHAELSDPDVRSFHHYHTVYAIRDES